MIPSIGRIVHYTLGSTDAEAINQRRERAIALLGSESSGTTLADGNEAREGQVYPMVITRVWGDTESSAVNGQVLLDGNDSLWVTSRGQVPADSEPAPGQWFAAPRV